MTTGKPDFNLNSFGIKYLTKDEVQEFLEKYEIPHGKDQAALATERDKKGTGFKTSESANALQTPVTTTPKPKEKPVGANSKTRSQFMSREDTTPKSHYARQIAGDIKESGGKVDESGIVSSGGDQSISGEHKGKRVPAHRIQPLHGKKPDGSDKDDSNATGIPSPKKQELGSIIGDSNTGVATESGNTSGKVMRDSGKEIKEITGEETEKDKKDKKDKKQSGGSVKGIKQLPKHTGDVPEGVKSETELVDGRNTKVGVGSEAHERFQKDPQGELTSSQKPIDPNKKDKRIKDLNSQHRSSKGVQSHNTRSRENDKYYNDDQKAAYKKIDPKDRTAQSKFHDEQDKKYGKSVDSPKKLSAAGQAIKDKLKKSNDIILDMNIMKLDLNKISTFKPKMNKRGGRILDTSGGDDRSFGEIRAQEEVKVQNKKNKLSKSADETIFKAISLKLDLMKVESSTPRSQFGSDLPAGRPSEGEPVKHENFAYVGRRGKRYKTEAELNAAEPPRKRRNIRAERAARDRYNADKRPTVAQRLQMVNNSLDMMNKLDIPKGIKAQKFVKPNMQSAGKNPATKPANAGGIQNKLETMQNEAPKVTPEKQAKDKKLLETGATGKPSGSVASQYT